MTGLTIAFFGSSLVSSYWNGAATYYRGLIRALAARGHRITFFEPDTFQRQQHRDMDDPDWAGVVVYGASEAGADQALARAWDSDVVVKASGVGVLDDYLERRVLDLQGPVTQVVFWDVDAPATLERLGGDADDPFRSLIPTYDRIFTYGGGTPVVDAYRALGARDCVPIYNALDPDTHYPVPSEHRFACDLAFLGNRMPDREHRVREFFFRPAGLCPDQRFVLGGSGWEQHCPELPNVTRLGHVYTRDHNAFNCSPRMVLNVNREGMARFGFSPPTRVFEAAGAGVCLITDDWPGIDLFLEPGREVLVARDGGDVAGCLRDIDPRQAAAIGQAARQRVLAEHTYAHRAAQVEALLLQGRAQPFRTQVAN